jgi:hypothetical protein
MYTFYHGKSSQKNLDYVFIFQKLTTEVNKRPMGEISPNLVTLLSGNLHVEWQV